MERCVWPRVQHALVDAVIVRVHKPVDAQAMDLAKSGINAQQSRLIAGIAPLLPANGGTRALARRACDDSACCPLIGFSRPGPRGRLGLTAVCQLLGWRERRHLDSLQRGDHQRRGLHLGHLGGRNSLTRPGMRRPGHTTCGGCHSRRGRQRPRCLRHDARGPTATLRAPVRCFAQLHSRRAVGRALREVPCASGGVANIWPVTGTRCSRRRCRLGLGLSWWRRPEGRVE